MENLAVQDVEDAFLEETIARSIREEKANIHVIVRNGFVFLSGEVKSLEVKIEIENQVRGIDGDRSVINHIRVQDLEDESYRRLEERVVNCPFKGADLLMS